VTTAVLDAVVGLGWAVSVTAAVPVPVVVVAATQPGRPVTCQAVLDVTVTTVESAAEPADHDEADRLNWAGGVGVGVGTVGVGVGVGTGTVGVGVGTGTVGVGVGTGTVGVGVGTGTGVVGVGVGTVGTGVGTGTVGGVTTSAGGWPVCVTVTVWTSCGTPAVVMTVTIAVRDAAEGLGCAVNVATPMPLPLVTVDVSHDGRPVTCQDVFDTTTSGIQPPKAAGRHRLPATTSVAGAAAWVTWTVALTDGFAVVVATVTVAVRADAVVFVSATSLTAALPTPLFGLAASHNGRPVICQGVLAVTCTDVVATNDPVDHDDADTANWAWGEVAVIV